MFDARGSYHNAEETDVPVLCKWWDNGAVMAHAGFPNALGTSFERIASQIAGDTDMTQPQAKVF